MVKTIKEMRDKDQFFTKEKISKKCIKITQKYIDMIKPSIQNSFMVEPSAGNGDFYYNFPKENLKLAFDIERPKHINKILPDFNYIESDFLSITHLSPNSIYIGNPPFGKSGKLAFDFIQKCIYFKAAIIAFILPPNINTKVRMDIIKERGYHLVDHRQLPSDSFYFYNNKEVTSTDAESVFQIYIKDEYVTKYNIKTIESVNIKNNPFVQAYTINTNLIRNAKRDVDGVPFIQHGIGTN